MKLYRPVGLEELLLIYRSGMRAFPPRLAEQPIFYPVLNADYATQIARDWNTKEGSLAGYVTAFEVDDDYARSFEVHQVGGRGHLELWVPAQKLDVFNRHITGRVKVIGAYFGPGFLGSKPSAFSLRGTAAREQLKALREIRDYNLMDFHGEVTAQHEAVFAHFPFWTQIVQAAAPEAALLDDIRRVWDGAFPSIPLGIERE